MITAKLDGRGMNNEEILDAILESREIQDVNRFLNPTENDLIPFSELKGLYEACEIINNTVDNGGNFLVFHDVDGDGICSGSIMTRYLQKMGANVKPYIGKGKIHGLNNLPLTELEGIDTLIIVDSIDDKVELYEKILDIKITIIVVDHHIIPYSLIEENVDITLVSCMNDYPNPSLSGSAVTWKLVSYIDYCNLTDYAEDLVDLAAAGLVGDMMDLSVPENRYICHRGFNNLKNIALKKIIGSYPFNSESISFSVAPLVNSCMRTNNNEIAMKLFLSNDENEVNELIKAAKEAKEEQAEIVDGLIGEVLSQGEEQKDRKCKVFFIPSEYRNMTGLVGNKVAALYQCPVLVLHTNDDSTISGSMRANWNGDFAKIINQTGFAIAKGHENSSGFICYEDVFEQFLATIEEQLKDVEFNIDVIADIELRPEQINSNLVQQLTTLNRISGSGWAPIKILVRTDDYEVGTFSTQKHLKITDKSGMLIVKWNCDDWKTMSNNGEIIAVGTLSNPRYGRKSYVQLTVDEYTQQNF